MTIPILSMMIKKSLLYVFPVGLMFYLMGSVFIDRSSQSGRSALNEAGRRAKEKGTRYGSDTRKSLVLQ